MTRVFAGLLVLGLVTACTAQEPAPAPDEAPPGQTPPETVEFPEPGTEAPLHVGAPEAYKTDLSAQKQSLEAHALRVYHTPVYPTRMAQGPGGRIFVSDAKASAVFVYNERMQLRGEIRGVPAPLGVAVGPDGNVLVGTDRSKAVFVYDAKGGFLRKFGEDVLTMPNDLAIGPDGEVFVADSRADTVRVFSPEGEHLRDLVATAPALKFPSDVALRETPRGTEVFVTDQGNGRVVVFDAQGATLRTIGKKADMRGGWQGNFVRPQALALDDFGRLFVADAYMHNVQVLDAEDGSFIAAYGEHGKEKGQLALPLDLLITRRRGLLVANADSGRVDELLTVHEVLVTGEVP